MMPNRLLPIAALFAAVFGTACCTSHGPSPKSASSRDLAPSLPAKAQLLPALEHMADAQLAMPTYAGNNPPADWVGGTFYVGLTRLMHVSDSTRFRDAALRIADRYNWQFQLARGHPAQGHADDECIGQMYIDLAYRTNDLGKLTPMRRQLDEVIDGFEHPTDATRRAWDNHLERDGASMPWWWCDSFFMAPPVFTRLSVVTGDRKYIDEMDKLWWFTTGKLYDRDEHLFYRDASFFNRKTPNGQKTFWSRGNGWVVAGTANVLTYMPPDYPSRKNYEQLFREMCARLLTLQQPDGFWRGSLLDPQSSPAPETSGTAFFCYAFAWGINHGLLERDKYQPAVQNAWSALNASIRPDGLIGWVQAIGDQPTTSSAQSTQAYAVGGYLLAGTEIIRLHGNP